MLLIEYSTCTTCAKAKKWLGNRGVVYTARHIKDDRPTFEELREWYPRSGLPLKRLFNTGGLVYRALGLKERLDSMPEDEQLRLLASDGMLVRRPVLITDDQVQFGFDEKRWIQALRGQK